MSFEEKNLDHIIWVDQNSLEVKVNHDVKTAYKPNSELFDILTEIDFLKKKKSRYSEELMEDLKKVLEQVKKYNYKYNSLYKKQIDEEEKKNKKKEKKEGKVKRILNKFKKKKN